MAERLKRYNSAAWAYGWLARRGAPDWLLGKVRRHLDRLWYGMTDWEKEKAERIPF